MSIAICEVGPRDGFQSESDVLEPSVRAELVDRLASTGLPRVEAVGFVHPERVPALAEAEEIVQAIERREDVVYAWLVLNDKSYDRLVATELDEVHFSFGVTDGFNRENVNASVEESLAAAERIPARARADGLPFVVSLSVAFGCPFAPRAWGNIATEDLVYLLESEGVETGGDLDALIELAAWLERGLGRALPGQAYRAGGFPTPA